MRAHRLSLGLAISFVILTIALLATSGMASEKVLHNFGISGADGQYPMTGLVSDGAGNLYGTTYQGGSRGFGTVFETSPNGRGGWTTKVLHNFTVGVDDGFYPTAGLIFDTAGNLYGTTAQGGSQGHGAVFEMTPNLAGGWTEKVLHNFGIGQNDGQDPSAGLVFDASGNLYGTTVSGGTKGGGTVFEMKPNASGGWTEGPIYSFGNGEHDAQEPSAGVIFDGAGNLYGTTSAGGSEGVGTVFELTPNGMGGWIGTVIHNFGISDNDGQNPKAGLILDGAGNLYGTTWLGGSESDGTVFEVARNGSSWTERVIHNFGISDNDGQNPAASLIFDGAGNLYGTTEFGGAEAAGTVFKMTPNGSGGWTETLLHNFDLDTNDGVHPEGAVILNSAGDLYGTTYAGGSQNYGTVFEVVP